MLSFNVFVNIESSGLFELVGAFKVHQVTYFTILKNAGVRSLDEVWRLGLEVVEVVLVGVKFLGRLCDNRANDHFLSRSIILGH